MANDRYLTKLAEIVSTLEDVYGLHDSNENGVKYIELDISDVIDYENRKVLNTSADDKKLKNIEAGKSTVLIAYIKDRLEFYGKRKLQYVGYPRTDVIAACLLKFICRETMTSRALNELNKVIFVLQEVDSKLVQHKFGLGYRFLRIFIVMALWGNYCNASVIARLVLNQLVLGESDAN